MFSTALLVVTACLLVALGMVLVLLAPGGHVDTRDLSSEPRWRYHLLNVSQLVLGLASFVAAGFAVVGHEEVFVIALVFAVLCLALSALDLGGVLPRARDPLPSHLLMLNAVRLILGGVLVVLTTRGLLG